MQHKKMGHDTKREVISEFGSATMFQPEQC